MKEFKENKIEKQNPIIKIIINKINSNKKIDQIWKKIKLKGYYKHLGVRHGKRGGERKN